MGSSQNGTGNYMYISKDGGVIWNLCLFNNQSNVPAIWGDMSDDGSYMYVLIQQNTSAGMWKSTDNGSTFTRVNSSASNNMDATVSPDGRYLSFLTYNSAYLMLSYDFGTTWVQTSNSGLNFGGQGIYMSGDTFNIFSFGDNKFGLWNITQVWTSTNYAGTWTSTPTDVMTSIGSISNDDRRMAINNDGTKFYVMKNNKEIWVSTDKLKTTNNFTKLTSTSITSTNKMVASRNCKYILTSTGTILYLTTQDDVVET
jgi:hypothetical protein